MWNRAEVLEVGLEKFLFFVLVGFGVLASFLFKSLRLNRDGSDLPQLLRRSKGGRRYGGQCLVSPRFQPNQNRDIAQYRTQFTSVAVLGNNDQLWQERTKDGRRNTNPPRPSTDDQHQDQAGKPAETSTGEQRKRLGGCRLNPAKCPDDGGLSARPNLAQGNQATDNQYRPPDASCEAIYRIFARHCRSSR